MTTKDKTPRVAATTADKRKPDHAGGLGAELDALAANYQGIGDERVRQKLRELVRAIRQAPKPGDGG